MAKYTPGGYKNHSSSSLAEFADDFQRDLEPVACGFWPDAECAECDSGIVLIVRRFFVRDHAGHGLLVDSGDEVGRVLVA